MGPLAGWYRLRLLREILDELVAGVEQFLLVNNVVAVEDGAALVPGQEHGDPFGDAGADQVAGGGAPGIVKLRPQVAEYADDEPAAQLSRIPIPLRNHQSRRLALLPFRLEFPRCRRSPCRTGYHRDV